MQERIETARLILRKSRIDDAEAIFRNYVQDADVARYQTWKLSQSIEGTVTFLKECSKDWELGNNFHYAITKKGSDEPIGGAGFKTKDFQATFGYTLMKKEWNQGYTTEVAKEFVRLLLARKEIYRIWSTCDLENIASARVLEKAGMEREGILRKCIIHPNISAIPRDVYIYAIVK